MKKKGIILLLSLGLAGLCALFMANTAPNEAERLSESCRHEYIDQKIEPTCTEKGYTEHLCTLCGAGVCMYDMRVFLYGNGNRAYIFGSHYPADMYEARLYDLFLRGLRV